MSAVNKVIHVKKCLVPEHITLANRKFEKMFSEKKVERTQLQNVHEFLSTSVQFQEKNSRETQPRALNKHSVSLS